MQKRHSIEIKSARRAMVDRHDLVDRSAIIRPELIEVRFIMKEHDDLRRFN
jgi:hypothetical protein